MLRDPFACKPAVLAETDDWVAMASEYRAIAILPGAADADVWEPAPGVLYSWRREAALRRVSAVATESEELDLARIGLRELNSRLHELARTPGPRHWRIRNPGGEHAVAAGLDADIEVDIDGHVGYYCAGMNKRATVRVHGMCGLGVAENIMSGTVIVDGNASAAAAATGRGGLVVIRGDAPARCGISMKGVDIVVGGSVGHMSAFMAQSGRLVVCGDAGDGARRLALRGADLRPRQVAGLGADCIEKELRAEHEAELRGLLELAGLGALDGFRRYGSARRLYNFHRDNAGEY